MRRSGGGAAAQLLPQWEISWKHYLRIFRAPPWTWTEEERKARFMGIHYKKDGNSWETVRTVRKLPLPRFDSPTRLFQENITFGLTAPLRLEKDTPDAVRRGILPHPRFMEWLMGFPREWASHGIQRFFRDKETTNSNSSASSCSR